MIGPDVQVGDGLPRLLTIQHAAERLDVSTKWIRRRIEEGELHPYQLTPARYDHAKGRQVRGSAMRISEAELVALLERMRL